MKKTDMLGKSLSKNEMKSVKGGFPPGCVAKGGLCVVGRPSTQAGGCCAGLYCYPDHQGGNNSGHCADPITEG